MRILMLGINYWPEETGIGVFNTGRCEYLASRGHEVTICTAFPFYPQWKVPARYRGRITAREVRNGVNILRSYLYVPSPVTPVRRVFHEASFIAGSCLRALAGARPDLLLAVSPPLGLAVSSILLSRLWHIPYVFHVADLQPDAAIDLGMLSNGWVAKGLYAVERMAYHHAAVVSTLTDAMRRRVLSKGIAAEKVILFSDWTDPALFSVPVMGGGEQFREAFQLRNQFLVVHAGNMGVKQGLEIVIETAGLSRQRPDIRYLLVGDGAVRGALEGRVETLKLANVGFLPLQPKEMFLDLLAATDVSLITQQQAVADIVFPSKVLTLLAAGRPVVASVNRGSEVARVIDEAGAGIVVEPGNPRVLLDAIVRLREDSREREEMGDRGRLYAQRHWNRERLLPGMEAELRRLTEERRDGGQV